MLRGPLHKLNGFSLVELSIVLVILGLLVGGVLSGQSLIRASELRSVATEYDRYRAAMGSFRDKYFGLPGDLNNAASFGWTDAAGSAVFSGDGNGEIKNSAPAGTNEISYFWIELANAGLLEGSFTRVTGGTTFTAGTNNPRAKMSSGGWNIIGLGNVGVAGNPGAGVPSFTNTTVPAATTFYSNSYGNALLFGSGTSSILPGGLLKSEEAWNIDTKVDDGKPDIGTVTTIQSQTSATVGSGCGNQASFAGGLHPAAYDLTNTSTTACSLVFKTGY